MKERADAVVPSARKSWRSGSAGGDRALAVLAAAAIPLLAPGAALGQGSGGGVDLQSQRIHGLQLRAPTPMESPARFERALQKRIQGSAAIDEAHLYLWNGGNTAVSVVHFGVADGAGYEIDRGLRGALNRMTRQLGGSPEKGPDAYSIRSASVSGHPARTGSKRIERQGQVIEARALVTQAGRDVWVVSVFGVEGERMESVADAVFESLEIEG